MSRLALPLAIALLVGCATGQDVDGIGRPGTGADTGGASTDDASMVGDSSGDAAAPTDSSLPPTDTAEGPTDTASPATDTSVTLDTSGPPKDTGTTVVDTGTKDTGTVVADTFTGGPITGGPCLSGAKGATAFRIRWTNSGGTATVSYEVTGLPDKAGFKVGAYTMSFSYKPVYSDIFLAEGGHQMDSDVFVDIDLSTNFIGSIKSATLSLYGRSFNTTASGSFTWQTFDGTGASGSISNAAPYHWDGTNITTGLPVGKLHKLRIRPGPPSSSLVVNRIELCIEAT